MRDTSEFPDAPEQAKTVSTRTRPPARPRSEGAASGGQEQEGKTAARRRTPPTSQGTPRPQHGNDTRIQHGNEARPQHGNDTRTQHGNETRPQHGNDTSTGSAPHVTGQRAAMAPQNNVAGHPHTQRPPGVTGQRYGGNYPSGQRNSGGHNAPSNVGSSRPAAPQRPGGPQRYGNAPQQQRSTHVAGTQTQQGGGHAHPGERQRYPGPRGGNNPTTTGTRSGGAQHTTANRPSGRPATPAQRPAERRVAPVKEKPTGPVSIPPQIVVKDLAELLKTTANEIIRNLIKHGIFANINQVIDYDKAALVATDLSFEPTQSAHTATPAVQSISEAVRAAQPEENTVTVPPVVTIMGHVDHGKTSLLDTIRKTKVAAGEAGGITQHIGAYQVEVSGKKITFLDTPGHEAFTAMRARGAQVAHIAIIVIAADDGVMPQTREAIDHARAAKMPLIIALNKIDKANANPDRVKQQLAEIDVVVEDYGGEIVCVPVSARKATGIDELLEYILLVAEMQDIKANPNRLATGVIIEAKLEKSSGPSATVLVQQGTLKMGDNIIVGSIAGKVRAMFNDRGKRIQKAPPGTPVSLLGLPEVPQAGDRLEVAQDERTAKQQAQQEAEKRRNETMPLGQVSLDTLYMQMQEGKVKELNIILKCDVQGSAEAIKNTLTKVGEENIKVRLISEGIGNISETDVHLATASGAIIIGFNVKADGAAQRQAQKEGVDIRYYNVIYKLIDDISAALTGLLEPTYQEVIEGHAEVIQIFKAGKTVVIAGCRITDGKITRSSQARVMRKEEKKYEGKFASLRRGKDDVREVLTGYECGIILEEFTDTEVGDIIEAFNKERVKPGA